MTDPDVTFYRLQGCPYCERVTRTLKEHGVDYQSRFVEARHSRRDVVKRLTGVRTVPAIVDESTGVTMAESANIVDYLETTYGQREAERDHEEVRADGGSGAGEADGTGDADGSDD